MEIKLTGGKALVAAVLGLGVLGFQYVNALSTLDTEGQAVLIRWIGTEYTRYHLSRTALDDEERARIILSLESLTLRELSARGTLDDLVVRAVIETHPAQPPGADPVRYFRMRYTPISGWLTPQRAYAHNYYLKLF